MIDISEIERLRRLTEEAIGRRGIVEDYEDQDDPHAFHVSRGRPTAIILPFRERA